MLWEGSRPSPVTPMAPLVLSAQETHGAMAESAAPIALAPHRMSCPAQHHPGVTTVLGILLLQGHCSSGVTTTLRTPAFWDCQCSGVTTIIGSPTF